MSEPLPFPDEWFPEDEDAYVPEPDEMSGEIYRVVDRWGRLGSKNRYYTTLKGAKSFQAGRYSDSQSRIQKGSVTWSELD